MSPGKIFEYMAARRLIVSSDLPVIAEVLNEGNAVLCGPEEIDAWERALSRASQDADWRERLVRVKGGGKVYQRGGAKLYHRTPQSECENLVVRVSQA